MHFLSFLSLLPAAALAATISPPSYPLAVRTPYLSTWLPGPNALNDAWPQFWAGQIAAWTGLIRVDGTTYSFLGLPLLQDGVALEKAVQTSAEYTSSQSKFVLEAGPVDITATFLSPIEPEDILKHSIPFSYLSLSVSGSEGHDVQIYTDISAEWASGDSSLTVNWTLSEGDINTHQIQLVDPVEFGEASDHTQYGSVFYSTSATGSAYQSGADLTVRSLFATSGSLENTKDTNFRAVSDNWPVFAFSHADVTDESSIVLSIGHVRDPVIQYIISDGEIQRRSAYFWSGYNDVTSLISEFLGDYSAALTRANELDSKVRTDAETISSDYADIVELSIRQAFAATEITIIRNEDGSWNTDDVLMFMKEISSNGNMNTVDVIFPAWPLYLYFNPSYGKFLLDALLRYQATGQYPNEWSIHDMGAHYPSALGHNDGGDEAMPIEETGNMIIMALSYVQKTGDKSMITTYSALFEQWAGYLTENALIPEDQLSTDDFAGPLANQTNLAIKGIVAIRAMAEIYTILGNAEQSDAFKATAADYVTKFQELAISSAGDHLTLAYGNDDSWGLSYNLFGDKLCNLNLFPESIYQLQTDWYKSHSDSKYGIPLDTRESYTKSDWEIWTSALVTNTETRDKIIGKLHAFVSGGTSSQPFGDWYRVETGIAEGFRARPVAGGHLAFLVLPNA